MTCTPAHLSLRAWRSCPRDAVGGEPLPRECEPTHTPAPAGAGRGAPEATKHDWHASCSLSGRLSDRRNSDMSFNLDSYLGIQPDALEVYSQRADVLAANIANADTPGYLAKDIDFRAALSAAGQGQGTSASAGGELQPQTT